MYCQLLQEKRAIHAHRDVLAWNQNIRFEKKQHKFKFLLKSTSINLYHGEIIIFMTIDSRLEINSLSWISKAEGYF